LSGKAPSQRQLRVGEVVRHALASVLQRGEIRDPLLEKTVLSISEVAMSPDLKIATVYVAPLGVDDPKPVIKALAKNVKQIRARTSPLLRQMKSQPVFRFQPDTSFDNYSRIDALLRSDAVARDLDDHDENNTEE
jgi:ribosome-binding factor A